mmetsp:Transcript_19093/g.36501  ORF Transcript_19093/g.36501 Transcript_19093/m.36501 type:complete len:122 (+) Transcript_19093:186-551(+)|eukprot:CAMPEP_0114254978 /NCGR_PEP_ID=MMETSP0058-20121206/17300_1 /TAXON_ID=36894 /ORGANISM="Pyramimonas parkeae, CCMP726" /LENGTH=121 /DNA_ID=CAMNT_0001369299 /DNA_START=186 /DNA_END=551 /DNA_ORIENTATION=+
MEEQPTNTSKGARGAGGNGSNGPKSARGHATGITGPSADVKRFNAGDAARLLAERYQAALTAAQSGDTSLPETQRTIIHQAAPAEGGSVWGRSNLALQAAVVDFPGELRAALARSKITAMA